MTSCPTPKKACHASGNAAAVHVRLLQEKDGALDVRPYRCQCGAWHVGHSRKSLRRRIRRALRRKNR